MENKNKNSLFVDNLPEELLIEVEADGQYLLNIASFKSLPPKTKIVINVGANSSFVGAMADFSFSSSTLDLTINLLGEGAKAEWHLAALSFGKARKIYETSVNHKVGHTEALVSNYGITRESSRMTFTGVSSIEEGADKSKTRQEAKIIVFDHDADGIASPILKISDNDVLASHAAVVGRLNEEHLFYLESRGLSEEEAKRLIALGYLKPIENYFLDKETITKIDSIIEGGI